MTVESLITQHIDTWTSAVKTKSTTGRGSSKKIELYGVKKLRELILELAVRGKLVPQDPNDEPASVLLERIAKEKNNLIKEKKIRKPLKTEEIGTDEAPFELPVGWEWRRLVHLVTVLGDGLHGTPEYSENGEYFFVNGNNLLNGSIQIKPETKRVSKEQYLKHKKDLNDRTVLVSINGTLGNVGFYNNEAVMLGKSACYFNLLHGISKDYIKRLIESPYFRNYAFSVATGSTIKNLGLRAMNNFVLAVPSEAEQHRIVAKVDELMALCDQLEQQTEASIEAHQLLVSTLLNTLTNSADADELMENWARISDHFDTLFTTEESIDQLKQTILQLAVMGKLVPQDPNDEPASVLLERIAEEKAQLIKEKKIKKQKALPPIADDEKPFDLPTGWEWCRTIDAGDIKLGRQRSPKDHSGPYMTPYLRVANVHDNRIDTTDVKEMNFTPEEQKTFSLEYGDILLNEGQSKELVGRPAMYRNEIPGACFQNTLLRFKVWSGVNAEFSLLYFRHCLYSGRFQKAVKQTTNMAHLSAARLIPIEFPLPPEKEQIRIVAKVEQLTEICNQLNIRLRDFQTTQLHLTDTIVEQAV
ncbi:TPA: restriction endonuclease subunit S [Photobacterium damselae]|uniref:restriction endonuclease subunit S n=1 Tax=Photobacterium damselae TaxID=38293 RepID=UPI0012460043|nr:restriction endonuclease subunit S [Photobacterium damselae]KAB1182728.1 restriction endonuclease subunit S [Photobacterium damselae subsp. damselae]